jgi:hypothetical protein
VEAVTAPSATRPGTRETRCGVKSNAPRRGAGLPPKRLHGTVDLAVSGGISHFAASCPHLVGGTSAQARAVARNPHPLGDVVHAERLSCAARWATSTVVRSTHKPSLVRDASRVAVVCARPFGKAHL